MSFIDDFIQTNFLAPLCNYYTTPATITYGIILIVAVIGTYRLLKALKVNIDLKFFLGVIPFIIYGGWTRALRDSAVIELSKYGTSSIVYQSQLFCSPPIYFYVFAVALSSLLLGVVIQRFTSKTKHAKKFEYQNTMLGVGVALLVFNMSMTRLVNITGFLMVSGLITFWSVVFYLVHKYRPNYLTVENAGIVVSHLFDASATFVAITYFPFYEQHVLPKFLIDIFGSWIMFPLKIGVVWPVLYAIDKSNEEVYFKKFLKIIILILGLALGTRDFLSLSMYSP